MSHPTFVRSSAVPVLAALALVTPACGSPPQADAPAAARQSPEPAAPTSSDRFAKADAVRGGQLYDTWWKVAGVLDPTEPTGDNPDYARTQGKKKGSATFRCKECHGWDYAGKDGAYGSGGRFTGVAGLQRARASASPETIYTVLRSGLPDGTHKVYASHLSEADTWDLVRFIKEGVTDLAPHVSLAKKEPIGADPKAGADRFSGCARCHGADGKRMNFGKADAPEFVGTVAVENPWEFLHKVRFGQPGTKMPAAVREGWSMKDAIDVLAYARTLPAN